MARAGRALLVVVAAAVIVAAPSVSSASAQAEDPASPTPAAAQDDVLTPGNYTGRIRMGTLTREYRLHIPTGYDPAAPLPLVINLHPYGATAIEQDLISGMSAKSDEAGFIAVFPQALGDPPTWVFGSKVEGTNIDVEFVRLLIRSLQERLNIDQARIFVTGFSNGAGLVHTLACNLSDIVAAVAPVAGVYEAEPEDCVLARPVPVIAFHGTGDDAVPYAGIEGDLMPVPAWAAGWAERNGCAAEPTITFEADAVTGETWSGCTDGADVALYSIDGLTHYWPRTTQIPEATFEIPLAGINATDVMWDFFAAHPLPQTVTAAHTEGFASGNYFGSVASGGVQRWYMVHAVEAPTPGALLPLIIDYHGAFSTPQWEALSTQFSAKADEAGFVVVYPEAYGVQRNWLFWANAEGQGPDDVQFTRDLVAELSSFLPIDPARIYVTGLSNGGGMANRAACELADMIAAFAQVAGTYPLPEGCTPVRPVPAMTFHGTADDVLPYFGVQGSLLSAPDWAANWAVRNGCDAGPAVILEEGIVTGEQWSGCLDNADVFLYTIDGFGHRWPRTKPITGLRQSTVTEINATDVIWDFFAAHPLPDHPSAAVSAAGEADAADQGFVAEPGDFRGDVESGGLTREYVMRIPQGYTGSAPVPMVIAFHGFGDSPVNFALTSGLLEKADAVGFVAVFPAAAGEGRGWSARPDEEGPDDVQFTRDLIDDLTSKINIDPARIYVTGFSRGGAMAHRVGCTLADRIAAVAPVGGGYPEAMACAPGRPVPVIGIHGTADTAAPYDGVEGRNLPVPDWAAAWAARNGCDPDAVESETTASYAAGDVTIRAETWGGCDVDANVTLLTLTDWGHFWPRGTGVDAIWDFFAAHPMPE